MTDAGHNVTAMVSAATGQVVERYAYDPYGRVTVLNGSADADGDDYSPDPDSASDVANGLLYAGYRFDAAAGLYHVRHRYHHPTLGRWINRDPKGYVDGMNLYEYTASTPTGATDPMGLEDEEVTKKTATQPARRKEGTHFEMDSEGNIVVTKVNESGDEETTVHRPTGPAGPYQKVRKDMMEAMAVHLGKELDLVVFVVQKFNPNKKGGTKSQILITGGLRNHASHVKVEYANTTEELGKKIVAQAQAVASKGTKSKPYSYDVLVIGHGNSRVGPYVEFDGEMTQGQQAILAENEDHVHAGPPSFGPRRKLGGRYLETEEQAKARNARAKQYYTKATKNTDFYKAASVLKSISSIRTTLTFMGCSAGRNPFGQNMTKILAEALPVRVRMPMTGCTVSGEPNAISLAPMLYPGLRHSPGDGWTEWWVDEDARPTTKKE